MASSGTEARPQSATSGPPERASGTRDAPRLDRDAHVAPRAERLGRRKRARRFATTLGRLTAVAWRRWLELDTRQLAAAIAFHALLSLAPLVILLVNVASALLGTDAAKDQIYGAIQLLAGSEARRVATSLVELIVSAPGGTLATTVGALVMIYFASGVFLQLRAAINQIWDVPSRSGWSHALYDWARSFVVVPLAVVAALVTLYFSLAASVAGSLLAGALLEGALVWSLLSALLSFALLAIMLAFIFRYVPDVILKWSDVIGGALLTAFLFTAGNILIGITIGRSLVASLYGAAGALVVGLLWVFYGAQILLFGVHFTRAYAENCGSRSRGRRGSHGM